MNCEPEWVEVVTDRGGSRSTYYWERVSNHTAWEKPDAPMKYRQSDAGSSLVFHCMVTGKPLDELPPLGEWSPPKKSKAWLKCPKSEVKRIWASDGTCRLSQTVPLGQPSTRSSSAMDWLERATESSGQRSGWLSTEEAGIDQPVVVPKVYSPSSKALPKQSIAKPPSPAKPPPPPPAASGGSEQGEWARRLRLLVSEEAFGMHLANVNWAWQEKWPDDPIENFKPCAKLKNGVKEVPDLTVVNDKIFLLRPASADTLQRLQDPGHMEAALKMAREMAAMDIAERREIRQRFDESPWTGWQTSLENIILPSSRTLYYCSLSLEWPKWILEGTTEVGSWTYDSGKQSQQEFCILARDGKLRFEEVRDSSKVSGDFSDADEGWKQCTLHDSEGKPVGYTRINSLRSGVLEITSFFIGSTEWLPIATARRKSRSLFHGYGEGPVQAASTAFQLALLQAPPRPPADAPKMTSPGGQAPSASSVAAHRRFKSLEDVLNDLAQANTAARKLFDPHNRQIRTLGVDCENYLTRDARERCGPRLMVNLEPEPLVNGSSHQAIIKRMLESLQALTVGVRRLLNGDPAINEPPVDLAELSCAAFAKIIVFAWMYALAIPDEQLMSATLHRLRQGMVEAHALWMQGEKSETASAGIMQVGSWEGILPAEPDASGLPLYIWEDLLEKSIRTSGEIELAELAMGYLDHTWPPPAVQYSSHWLKLLYLERCAELAQSLEEAEEALLQGGKAPFKCEWTTDKQHRPDFDLRPEQTLRGKYNIRRGDLVLVTPYPVFPGRSLIAEARADFCPDQDKTKDGADEKPLVIKLKLFCIILPNENVVKAFGSTHLAMEPLSTFQRVTHDRQVEAARAATREGGPIVYCDSIRRMIVDSWKLQGPGDESDPSSPQSCAADCPQDFPALVDQAQNATLSPAGIPLTNAQQAATLFSLRRRCTLIRGPPGTGKTHTACAIIDSWLALSTRECQVRVLVVTQSNVAAFNIQERLSQFGLESVRIGMGMPPQELLSQPFFCMHFEQKELSSLREVDQSYPAPGWVVQPFLHRAAKKARVVVMTCISSGNAGMLNGCNFHRVLLDEAAQATEPTALVPLMTGAAAFTCVGDDKQLPATILSKKAKDGGLDESLFERLLRHQVVREENGFVQLDVQRRMHSSISRFPSDQFYGARVQDGVDDAQREVIRGFKWPQDDQCRVCFIEAGMVGEAHVGTSIKNTNEAMMLVVTLMAILDHRECNISPDEIAAITGYAAQKDEIRYTIQRISPRNHPARRVRIDTVDGFQGMERDLVLVSTVRSNDKGDVGFLRDKRRTNVLLTRAKRGLIVFGDNETLMRERLVWKPWICWVHRNNAIIQQSDLAHHVEQ